MSDPITLTPAQRAEILDILHQLAEYALEGWEDVGIEEAPEWRKRLEAAKDLLSKHE